MIPKKLSSHPPDPNGRAALFLAAIWMTFHTAAIAAPYQLVDLGASVSAYGSYATAINEAGVVAGLDYPDGTITAAVFEPGQTPRFPAGTPISGTQATAINRSGQVIGSDANEKAAIFAGNRMIPVVRFSNAASSATGINDAGDIVGSYSTGGPSQAYVWHKGKLRTLGFLPGDDMSLAMGINHKGQITGGSVNGMRGEFRAFLYQGGKMTVAAAMKGRDIFGNAINDGGDIAGVSYQAPSRSSSRAFVRSGGIVKQFGPLKGDKHCAARDINSSGQVVGSSDRVDTNASYSSRVTSTGFIYTDGRLLDLNSLVVALGWKITSAAGINDRGQIAATALNSSGVARAIRLDPAATVQFSGPSNRSTSSRIFKLRGTASAVSSVARVEYRFGKKGHYRLATGTTHWQAKVKLKRGTNRISLRIIAASGESSLPIGLTVNAH
jgi:probable HAF family extracellular repeat protein